MMEKPKIWLHQDFKKPSVLDELVSLLRKLLDCCLCCITCGCYPGKERHFHEEVYETELMEEEKLAIQNLLKYLDSEQAKNPTINDERLRALCILTYSDNEELQRSAALCYAEISERMKSPVSEIILEPLVTLVQSRHIQVQKAASLAVSNFAVYGPENNKTAIVECGAIKPLVKLLSSESTEVQCNACGCITTLATNDRTKEAVVTAGGISPLISLARATDVRVQRNATGALLNLSHQEGYRNELVHHGALPTLVEILYSKDHDVQYYCSAALSNFAVNEKHRAMMIAVGHHDIIRRLIQLLGSPKDKVRCQACLSLRNLASDGDNQILIVKLKGLGPLHAVMQTSHGDTLTASIACLRNLAIHKCNELDIIAETFLSELKKVLRLWSQPDAQIHAAGTIRNLAAGEQISTVSVSGCVEALCDVIMSSRTHASVMNEVTAALAVLSDEEVTRQKLLVLKKGNVFRVLVYLAAKSISPEVQYNCAGIIGQLSLMSIPAGLLQRCQSGILDYLQQFLTHEDPNFIHIALWTLVQLLKEPSIKTAFTDRGLQGKLRDIASSDHTDAIKELAKTVQERLDTA